MKSKVRKLYYRPTLVDVFSPFIVLKNNGNFLNWRSMRKWLANQKCFRQERYVHRALPQGLTVDRSSYRAIAWSSPAFHLPDNKWWLLGDMFQYNIKSEWNALKMHHTEDFYPVPNNALVSAMNWNSFNVRRLWNNLSFKVNSTL